jgi:RHS repeat-associated protein
LEGTTKPNGEEITYHYDTRGNRTNHIGNTTITYNTIADTYGYNNWDELSQFATGGIAYQYQYDPEGLRAKKESTSGTVRYHLDNNGRVIAESDASDQITAQNIWGHKALARKVNGAYYYYIYNGHGDVVQVLDVNGIVVNSYSYDEWGNITSKTETIENPIRYAGEYYDEESGLYYLRARYYDPTTGRFISEDSNEGNVTNPLSLNLYTYCTNNPIIYVDPSGNESVGTWLNNVNDNYIGGPLNTFNDRYIGGPLNQIASGDLSPVEPVWDFVKPNEADVAYFQAGGPYGLATGGAGYIVRRGGKFVKLAEKAVNLPAWKKVAIDMDHIISRHTMGGSRASKGKSLFPKGMSEKQIEITIRDAYRNGKRIQTQDGRALIRGTSNKLTVEMWINLETKTIETAYPITK